MASVCVMDVTLAITQQHTKSRSRMATLTDRISIYGYKTTHQSDSHCTFGVTYNTIRPTQLVSFDNYDVLHKPENMNTESTR